MTEIATWKSYQSIRSQREAHWFVGARVDVDSYAYALTDTQQQAEELGAIWLAEGYTKVQVTIPEWVESAEGDVDETPIPDGYDTWGVAELTASGLRPAYEVDAEEGHYSPRLG